jgi:hypothetical protein
MKATVVSWDEDEALYYNIPNLMLASGWIIFPFLHSATRLLLLGFISFLDAFRFKGSSLQAPLVEIRTHFLIGLCSLFFLYSSPFRPAALN